MKMVENIVHSTEYVQVRRRIFRQLVESFLFENIVEPTRIPLENGMEQFLIHGEDRFGNPVMYQCKGKQSFSFQRIRLTPEPVIRRDGETEREADSFSLFIEEVTHNLDADWNRLSMFQNELKETHLKDALAQYHWQQKEERNVQTYDEIESEAMEGHPYHPSYKSRIGFTMTDHVNFGPDFMPTIGLIWLAVSKNIANLSISQSIHYEEWVKRELGEKDVERFRHKLHEKNLQASDYLFLPVHPWQWEHVIIPSFLHQLNNGAIVLLGEGTDRYVPQQSIRTLANQTDKTKCYVKLPLSITNTSTNRILAPHTVENAAKISDWLRAILHRDSYLKEELGLVLLFEVVGISVQSSQQSTLENESTYGVLSGIWRESIHSYLKDGEDAVPYNAIYHRKKNGTPLIQGWIEQYGVESWVKQLLHVSITPLIHLLYAHGIAMESHAQNMVLIHRNGWPVRLALKDFHDGIRFQKETLTHPELLPDLAPTPDAHKKVNRNSFIETDDVELVRDFVHDAFFFINLSELAYFFDEGYGLDENVFWMYAKEVIEAYHSRFSHLQERFRLFDLFAETIQVEQLTKRRMYPETELRIQRVKNPLFVVKGATTC